MSKTPHEEHVLSVQDLHVHYGKVCAVHNVSFEISCGHAVALIGPNGAGKSTLLKAIVGLVKASAGGIQWRNQPVAGNTNEIAYLPQRAQLDWEFPVTVRGLVEMGRYPLLGPWRTFGPADREAADHALETMHLTDVQHRHISELSGGQQQRAFLARALAQEAHVVLLDEPFAGLDRAGHDDLARLLRSLAQDHRLILASHHDLHTAGEIFDHALLLNREAVAFGTVAETLTETNLAEALLG